MKHISVTLQPDVIVCIVYIDVDFQLLPSSANMCLCVHVRVCMCLRVARACVRICVRASMVDVYCTRTNHIMLSWIDIQFSRSISPPHSLPISLPLSLSPALYLSLSRALYLYLSLPHSLSLHISLCISLPPSPTIYLPLPDSHPLSLPHSHSLYLSPLSLSHFLSTAHSVLSISLSQI